MVRVPIRNRNYDYALDECELMRTERQTRQEKINLQLGRGPGQIRCASVGTAGGRLGCKGNQGVGRAEPARLPNVLHTLSGDSATAGGRIRSSPRRRNSATGGCRIGFAVSRDESAPQIRVSRPGASAAGARATPGLRVGRPGLPAVCPRRRPRHRVA